MKTLSNEKSLTSESKKNASLKKDSSYFNWILTFFNLFSMFLVILAQIIFAYFQYFSKKYEFEIAFTT